MSKSFKLFIPILIIAASLIGITAFLSTPTFADSICGNSSIPLEIRQSSGCSDGGGSDKQIADVIQNILNSIIAIAGVIAVVFVLIGGIKFMTSTGDAGKVKKAKDTILYACIGLIICALAFAIVNFTIGIINQSTS